MSRNPKTKAPAIRQDAALRASIAALNAAAISVANCAVHSVTLLEVLDGLLQSALPASTPKELVQQLESLVYVVAEKVERIDQLADSSLIELASINRHLSGDAQPSPSA